MYPLRFSRQIYIRISAMKSMIKYMADRASSAKTTKQQEEPALVAPAFQDDEYLPKQRRLPAGSK